jgi:DNA invertase Pin-like site-specific DNA recombinase
MLSSVQKIAAGHLERLAVVYLRQSSPKQVRENFRSTERQYGLAEEAARLGWEAERILTVDGDLGVSGRDTHARGGYKELVGRVCLGEVGAIFGLEVSRLARSSAETQRLLEYCGLTDTLVIDTDGIYDLRDFNDQLVLGVKGQLAQAELHVMAVRLQGAKRHAAERGELHFPLPVGLVYDDEGQTIIDPDEEAQAAIGDVFKAFVQTGSAYGVVGVFKNRRFPRRAYGGAWAGELRWGRLTHARAIGVLSNPSYAGAYVFGRYRSRRVVRPDGTIVTRTVELPRSEWPIVIHDHHEGYISWEQFLSNEQRLASNNNRNGQRPPREGSALCQGILRCGACGGSMTTLHRREGSYYECGHSRADHVNTPGCRSVKATVVDEVIAGRLLETLAPEEIALALAAAEEHADRRARSDPRLSAARRARPL